MKSMLLLKIHEEEVPNKSHKGRLKLNPISAASKNLNTNLTHLKASKYRTKNLIQPQTKKMIKVVLGNPTMERKNRSRYK
jgi:hypothetical protein